MPRSVLIEPRQTWRLHHRTWRQGTASEKDASALKLNTETEEEDEAESEEAESEEGESEEGESEEGESEEGESESEEEEGEILVFPSTCFCCPS